MSWRFKLTKSRGKTEIEQLRENLKPLAKNLDKIPMEAEYDPLGNIKSIKTTDITLISELKKMGFKET